MSKRIFFAFYYVVEQKNTNNNTIYYYIFSFLSFKFVLKNYILFVLLNVVCLIYIIYKCEMIFYCHG